MLDKLIQVMLPPAEPLEAGSREAWPQIEEALGTALPQDYKDYINTYGTGYIGGFLWVYNPFAQDHHIDLITEGARVLAALRQSKSELSIAVSEKLHPYELWPEENGLLPWGKTDNGDKLFWQTTGHPDQWTVVAVEHSGPDVDRFPGSMTSFLQGVISGSAKSKVVPYNDIDRDHIFMSML